MSQVPNSYSSAGAPARRKLRPMGAPSVPGMLISTAFLLGVLASIAGVRIPYASSFCPVIRAQRLVRGQTPQEIVSPLQALVTENNIKELLGEEDRILVQKISDQSSLEFKTLLISETIVPKDSADKLLDFVKTQLLAKEDVITPKQAAAILEMVRLSPRESVVEIEAIGDRGSLSSSIALALIKQHEDNIHYMLVAVKAEPHLGLWKRLSQAERNSWNGVISKMLKEKVALETSHYLKHGNGRAVEPISEVKKPAPELQKAAPELQESIPVPEDQKPISSDQA